METILIQCGLWAAEIAPSLGANVIKLTHNGNLVLRTPEQSVDAYQFGMPILLPANRTKAGKFTFEGKEYSLPINEPHVPAQLHGLVHDRHFTVLRHSETEAVLSYCNTPDIYPFPFRITVTYTMTQDGIHVRHKVENIGETNMPYTFCLHTTFAEPEHFSVPLGLEQQRDAVNLPTGPYIPLSEDQQPMVTGVDPRTMSISGYYKAAGHTAHIGPYRYESSENYDHWVLYNAGGNVGILCVEPQCGGVNGLNIPDGHRVLAPGESEIFDTRITV